MLVSNNNLLNILLPNENKILNDVLKEADTKTLNNIKSGSTTVQEILKNLFTDLKTGNKTKATIENILKNSNLFKDLGNFSKSITTLMNQIDSDSNLSKFKPFLQNFLKDISTLDDKSLKELISKSGIFLESKALEQVLKETKLPKNLETILTQIKTIIKDISSVEAKNINNLIDKILQNNSKATNSSFGSSLNLNTQNTKDLKVLVNLLQNLSKNIGDKQVTNLINLTNSLRNISREAQLLESKINNQTQVNNKQETNPIQNKTNILNKANINNLNLLNTKQDSNPIQNQTNFLVAKENISANTKELLTQLRNEILFTKNTPNASSLLKQIDNLLQSNNLFNKNETLIEPKNLLNQLTTLPEIKTIANENSNIASLVNKLKSQIQNINTLETKILQNQNVQGEKIQLTQDLNQTLNSLKNELLHIKNIDIKIINNIIDKLLGLQNIFNKIEVPLQMKAFEQNILNQTNILNSFQSNFSSNINNLILLLKEATITLSQNQNNPNLQQNILKIIDKIESATNNFIQNNINNSIPNNKIYDNSLQNDMKSVLFQMQEELLSKSDGKAMDTIKQVDKMLMQIEYFQLLSASSNTNSVYIPFIWDILDEGSISMKRLDEEKFYCEINLYLKEFGQTQILLALYDKNRLDLTIYASKQSFKQAIRENSTKLKQALNSVNLIPVNINIIDLKKEEKVVKEQQPKSFYDQNINLGLGVNIKV